MVEAYRQTSLQTYIKQVKVEQAQAPQQAADPQTPATPQPVASTEATSPSFDQLKADILKDNQVDQDEAKFLMDQLSKGKFDQSVVPQVTELLSKGYQTPEKTPSFALIGKTRLNNVQALSKDIKEIKEATQITDENGIDEVYFKNEAGKLFVAYGSEKDGGALDMRGMKVGYVGRLGKEKVTVVHINNETNTIMEGAKAPWVSTYDTLSKAGQNGIVKGIGEVATTVTALFIGKTVLEKGMKTVGTQVGTEIAGQVAQATAEKATEAAAKTGLSTIGKARALGTSIGATVKDTLKTVAVAGAVAGAVVGTVVTIGSAIGAVRSQTSFKDYATLNMVTGKY